MFPKRTAPIDEKDSKESYSKKDLLEIIHIKNSSDKFIINLLYSFANTYFNDATGITFIHFSDYLEKNLLKIKSKNIKNFADIFISNFDIEIVFTETAMQEGLKREYITKICEDLPLEESLLHIAARRADLQLITELVGKGADINIRDINLYTPFMFLVEYNTHLFLKEILIFINNMIDLGANVYDKDGEGHTIFDIAILVAKNWIEPLLPYAIQFDSKESSHLLQNKLLYESLNTAQNASRESSEKIISHATNIPNPVAEIINNYYLPQYGYFSKRNPTQQLFLNKEQSDKKSCNLNRNRS